MDHKVTTAQRDLEHILVQETAEPKALPLSLLEDMTDHFSDDLEIGRGGFAVVYKGKLGDKEVAVKRLSKAYMHEKEFDREIQCLIRAKHKNVVRFLGYCDDRQRNMERCDEKFLMADIHQRLFCFEYMPKGSLDKYINTHHEWETCYKIIKGICEGLQYLHDNSIIHLDLKPANILLNDDMVPKITDFGLSRCLDENQSQVFTKTISGTMGYLAPERYEGSGIKPSGDLYSLGIIIMEILTGQKQPQDTKDVLETWSDRLERSQQDRVYEQIRVCNEIASNCMQLNPKDRPASAGDIIDRLHKMERIQKLRQSAIIGILELEILGARDLAAGVKNPYVVAKYGKKWVRTRTLLNTTAPQWNEQCSWDVFDVSTVIIVALFNDYHGDANDQRIGKVRVRLATLETDRVYSQYYPLLALSLSGLNKSGELHLAVRFTCKSWAKMLAMYGKPMLPKMHHTNPISVLERDYLRFQAMGIVASQLARDNPPLRREVVAYVLDVDSYMFSLRRSKANFNRITLLFSGAVAVVKWFDGICKWKNPMTTILVHVVFLKLVCCPELILPVLFLCMIIIGAWNYFRRPRGAPHIDTMLSRVELAHPNELDEEFGGLQPPHIDAMLRWYNDVAYHDELDEEFDTFPTSKPDDIVRLRYERLRSLYGMVQTVVGDLAAQGERAESLLHWHDPRLTPVFIALSLVMPVLLYLTPFRLLTTAVGLYFLRPPWFRGRTNLLLNLYSRLPSKDDVIL